MNEKYERWEAQAGGFEGDIIPMSDCRNFMTAISSPWSRVAVAVTIKH